MSKLSPYILVLSLLIFSQHSYAQNIQPNKPTPEQLAANNNAPLSNLQKIDLWRAPGERLKAHLRIDVHKDDKITSSTEFLVLTDGPLKLVLVKSGASKDQRFLFLEKSLWLFIPKTRRSVRITPIQRISGQVSYGDVAGLTFSSNYQEIMQEKDPENPQLSILTLKSTKPTSTYRNIFLTVNDRLQPINAKFSLASGKILKTVQYKPPTVINSHTVLHKSVFKDTNIDNQATHLETLNIDQYILPKRYFNREGMKLSLPKNATFN